MAKQLKSNVYVDGVLYGPDGEQPSAEVAERIENPKAWDGEDEHDFDQVPAGDPSKDWSVKQLEAYAAANNIDLSGASSKADKLAAVQPTPSA